MSVTTKRAPVARKNLTPAITPELEPEVVAKEAVPRGRKPKLEPEVCSVTSEREVRQRRIAISRPKFEEAQVHIQGTVPLVLHKFSQKTQDIIRQTQEAGSQNTKGKKREARVFADNYQNARHISRQGWDGIPASAFRNAMISACRTVGFKMTIAKMSVFVVADGIDEQGTGLVRITKGEPHMDVRPGRNSNGSVDLRARPMWEPGWTATVTVRWDADQFSAEDVINLMARAGQQVGVGEGRPDSKMSAGCGWGEFEVLD